MKNTKGFTLIELLVVVLIIGILAAIALPQYFKAVEKSRASEAFSVFSTLAGAEQRYYLLSNTYTNNLTALDITFTNYNGTETTAGLTTNSFNINVNPASETITAVRNVNSRFGAYTLTKNIATGQVTCSGATGGFCETIGI